MLVDRRKVVRAALGRPYRPGAEGPEAFDCYGLVRHLSGALFARDLPSRDGVPHVSHRGWRRIEAPQDGAVVFMGSGAIDRHVGLYLQDGTGAVVHALEGVGVIVDDLLSLRFRGFGRLRMFVPR